MKPHVHYEAAFEDYIRSRGTPYVAVVEARRAIFHEVNLKSFDFIVYSSVGTNWLVDIKGRRWVARRSKGRPTWENWVTQEDLDGLRQWEEVFGKGFAAMFVFAYWLNGDSEPPADIVHTFRNHRYVFAGIPREVYAMHARIRSPKWGTLNLRLCDFAAHVRPMGHWLEDGG